MKKGKLLTYQTSHFAPRVVSSTVGSSYTVWDTESIQFTSYSCRDSHLSVMYTAPFLCLRRSGLSMLVNAQADFRYATMFCSLHWRFISSAINVTTLVCTLHSSMWEYPRTVVCRNSIIKSSFVMLTFSGIGVFITVWFSPEICFWSILVWFWQYLLPSLQWPVEVPVEVAEVWYISYAGTDKQGRISQDGMWYSCCWRRWSVWTPEYQEVDYEVTCAKMALSLHFFSIPDA